jgi:hypothetical protein
VLVILGSDSVPSRREAGQASAVLKQGRADEHVDESGNISQRTIASTPDNSTNALLGDPRWRMRADCGKYLWKPPKADRGEPVVYVRSHEPSPSK